jgi:hypothetical protein
VEPLIITATYGGEGLSLAAVDVAREVFGELRPHLEADDLRAAISALPSEEPLRRY